MMFDPPAEAESEGLKTALTHIPSRCGKSKVPMLLNVKKSSGVGFDHINISEAFFQVSRNIE
jgi:hypothetical protein